VYDAAESDGGRPIRNLNELEFVTRRFLFANQYGTQLVYVIDAQSGTILPLQM
jgi:glutamine cyclotransferase